MPQLTSEQLASLVDLRSVALDLYDAGLISLPAECAGHRKRTLVPWKETQTARPSRETVDRWFRQHPKANAIWVKAGHLSRVVILDVDTPEGLAWWRSVLGDLLDKTACVLTPSGGWHFWFRLENGGFRDWANTAGQLALGIKFTVRCETGGVIVPPSNGGKYRWERNLTHLQPAPDALRKPMVEGRGERLDLGYIFNGVPRGDRDGAAFRYASRLRSLNVARSEAKILMERAWERMEPSADDPFMLDDALSKVDRVYDEYRAGRSYEQEQTSSWASVDLSAIVRGENPDPLPTVLVRDDGRALFYAGKCHVLHGETESLKSWAAQVACAQEIVAGRHVLYFDFEDSASGVTNRLLALGVPAADIVERFHYSRPVDALGEDGELALKEGLALEPTLAVIDGVTEAMMLHGLDPRSEIGVAQFHALLAKKIASQGPAVVSIDHETHSSDGHGRPIGSQHKRAGIDGASYSMAKKKPFGHGQYGIALIGISKDRPGRVREHHPSLAGELHLISKADGSVTVELRPPSADKDSEAGVFRPTYLMERVSRFLEEVPQGRSKNVVSQSVKGKTDAKRLAIDLLIEEGFVRLERSGQAHMLRSIKPFREGGEVVGF